MDKYIYILAGIISLASNFFKSTRKKEDNKESLPEKSSGGEKKDIKTILEEILLDGPVSETPKPLFPTEKKRFRTLQPDKPSLEIIETESKKKAETALIENSKLSPIFLENDFSYNS